MTSSGAPSCIICGALIHNRSRKLPWLKEFRAVRSISSEGEPFLTGVGVSTQRGALLSAPSNPDERYNDVIYEYLDSDDFVPQGRTTVENPLPGFAFHDACWVILRALVQPHNIPIAHLYDICLSFPSRKTGLLDWGPDYGKACSDMDAFVHGRPENYQSSFFLSDPLEVERLQAALKESERGKVGESAHGTVNVVSSGGSVPDFFCRLPVEIREQIQVLLDSRDVVRLRAASRSFASLPFSQRFWRSRFHTFYEREFIFEMCDIPISRYDWKVLYEKTDPRLKENESLRNRRRVWECNKPLAELLILQSAMNDGGEDAMDEHNNAVWRTAALEKPSDHVNETRTRGNMQFARTSPYCPPPDILKEYAIRIPNIVSQVAVSLVSFNNNNKYISGIRILTPDFKETRLGYIHPGHEVILDISGSQPGPRELTGFVTCAEPGGIRGIKAVISKDIFSDWAGDHENVPRTLRLCLDRRISHLKAKFDAFRMIALSVTEERLIGDRNPPPLDAHKAAFWYPDIPPEDQSLHEIDLINLYYNPLAPSSPMDDYKKPLIRLMFGGQDGEYLPYLTAIATRTQAGILTWIDFYYGEKDAPLRSLSVAPYMAGSGEESSLRFSIEGSKGERLTGVKVRDKQWQTTKDGPAGFSITTLEVCTNFHRRFTFDANVLPRIRLPLGIAHNWQKRKTLEIDPDSTITGLYITQDPVNGLTGLGAISEMLGKGK